MQEDKSAAKADAKDPRVNGVEPITPPSVDVVITLPPECIQEGSDSQWFDYKPTFYGAAVRVEWEKGTMRAAYSQETAVYLIHNGYARAVTAADQKDYTEEPSAPVPEVKSKRKERNYD